MPSLVKDKQFYKFCGYGFLKNLRFFDAFFILFLVEKGLSFTQIGILYAIREIVVNIVEIPSGIFADTFGRKNSLIGSFIFYIFSFVVFFLSGSFWLFMIAFIFYGMADAFRSGTHKAMIMDYLKTHAWEDHKINYYGHTRSCSQKGSALAALVAGVLVFYYGSYQMIFLFSVIPYLLNLVLIISYPRELNHSMANKKTVRSFDLRKTFQSFVRIIKQPNVLKIVNSSALHSAYQRAVKDYIQPLMLQVAILIPFLGNVDIKKKSGLVIGIIYFIIFLLTSQASKMASQVDKKIKNKTSFITLLYGFFFGLTSGILCYFEFWIISLVFFVGIYLVENIRKPVLTGLLADNVPNEILTSVISAESLWKTLMTAILAISFGLVADYFGIGLALGIISSFLLFITIISNKSISN